MKAHLEKFPIAYSNKYYIYIIVPGSYELNKASLENALYSHKEVFTEFNEEIANLTKMLIIHPFSPSLNLFRVSPLNLHLPNR